MIDSLEELATAWDDCARCGLCESRRQVVHGYGDPNARIFVISDKPGKEEDKRGVPMVGPAGEFYQATLRKLDLDMSDVWTTNSVACRTPDNRDPFEGELRACRERLLSELLLVDPDIIIIMGRVTTDFLLGVNKAISKLQMRDFLLEINTGRAELQYVVTVTYNPAWIRKNPSLQRGQPWHYAYRTFKRAKTLVEILEKNYGTKHDHEQRPPGGGHEAI